MENEIEGQSAQSDEGVQAGDAPLGVEEGTQSEEPQAGDSDSPVGGEAVV